MPQGDKSSYTDKQKRQAAHIEAGYEKRGAQHEKRGSTGLLEQPMTKAAINTATVMVCCMRIACEAA